MKKKKKADAKPEKVETTPAAMAPQQPEQPEEKPFDFGGMPARDLKKNLGCG